jgi:serine protease
MRAERSVMLIKQTHSRLQAMPGSRVSRRLRLIVAGGLMLAAAAAVSAAAEGSGASAIRGSSRTQVSPAARPARQSGGWQAALAGGRQAPVAHIAGPWFPDDPGHATTSGGWQQLQWNFLAADGVDAPTAWANLIADRRPGAQGTVIAVLDTGVAYRRWRKFRESPDFRGTQFVDPCDLVVGRLIHGRCTDPYALDREGHGTFVAGMIAEATNNGIGLTGLAYGAKIMPVRVLDASGNGNAHTIAQGIRYAVDHGANVVNLSLEFSIGVSAGQIPGLLGALRYAHKHNVVVTAAAGNDSSQQIAYPARAADVISVGATTADRCIADYSNAGVGLDLVAPGGGNDATLPADPNCHPGQSLPDLYQMTFNDPAFPGRFSLPSGWYGTSMSAAEVAAGAAMVIASGVLGPDPTPDQVLTQLERTAQPLAASTPNSTFGYGLLDLGAATAGAAPPPTQTTTSATTAASAQAARTIRTEHGA